MTKLKTPLLSFDARGNLGRAITFLKRRGRHIIEHMPTPTDTKSSDQLFQRHMFTKCVDLWHTLSAAEKQTWERLARPLHMTGYAWYISQCLRPNPGIYLPLQGGTMQGDIDMDSHKILDLPDPVAEQGADTKAARNTALLAHTSSFSLHAKVIRKTATESIINSIAQTSDAHLKFPVLANEIWTFWLYLRHNRQAGGIKNSMIVFTVPAEGVLVATNILNAAFTEVSALSLRTLTQYDDPTIRYFLERHLYIGGANAGTVQLQWRQIVAENYYHYFLINSFIIAHQLA